jgi:hypothetical protein
MGDRRYILKSHRASLFNDDLSNEPSSAGSISLDSTFNKSKWITWKFRYFIWLPILQDYDFQKFQSKNAWILPNAVVKFVKLRGICDCACAKKPCIRVLVPGENRNVVADHEIGIEARGGRTVHWVSYPATPPLLLTWVEPKNRVHIQKKKWSPIWSIFCKRDKACNWMISRDQNSWTMRKKNKLKGNS